MAITKTCQLDQPLIFQGKFKGDGCGFYENIMWDLVHLIHQYPCLFNQFPAPGDLGRINSHNWPTQ